MWYLKILGCKKNYMFDKKLLALNSISELAYYYCNSFTVATVQILEMHDIRSAMTDSDPISLGNPFFEEKGNIINRRILSVEPEAQVEHTISLIGIINGNVSVTDIGTIVSTLRRGSNGEQIIKSATEVASMLLKIDDVIAGSKSKMPPGPPGGGGGGMGGMGGGYGGGMDME
jgi:hypothetical protein